MWRDLIQRLDAHAQFHPPATKEAIATLEQVLGTALPDELTSFLLETNGAQVVHGLAIVWSTEEMADRNLQMRRDWGPGTWLEHAMPVDHLLFFGDAGNGDLFAFPATPAGVRSRVFVWDHEDDSRVCKAPTLSAWLSGSPY